MPDSHAHSGPASDAPAPPRDTMFAVIWTVLATLRRVFRRPPRPTDAWPVFRSDEEFRAELLREGTRIRAADPALAAETDAGLAAWYARNPQAVERCATDVRLMVEAVTLPVRSYSPVGPVVDLPGICPRCRRATALWIAGTLPSTLCVCPPIPPRTQP